MSKKLVTEDRLKEIMRCLPDSAPYGVYVYSTDGYLYPYELWDSGATNVIGVALITDNCKFVVAPDEVYAIQWGGYGTLINGIPTTTASAEAQQDYDGENNTKTIVNTIGATAALFEGIPIIELADLYNTQTQQGQLQASSQKGSLKGGSVASSDVVINKPISDAQAQEWTSDGQNLTQEQQQQLTEYNDAKLKEDFCAAFGITTEAQFNWVIAEIRTKLVEALPGQTNEFKLTEENIANITDLGIMTFALGTIKPAVIPMALTQNSNTNMYAALYCTQYSFKNGKKGYLGACGEIYAMYQNLNNINTALNKIGGTPIPTSGNGYVLWSSTQTSSINAWLVYFNVGNVGGSNKYHTNTLMGVRPLAAI